MITMSLKNLHLVCFCLIACVMAGCQGGDTVSGDEAKRAEMQAEAGNERLKNPDGAGGPEAGGEAAARAKHSGQ